MPDRKRFLAAMVTGAATIVASAATLAGCGAAPASESSARTASASTGGETPTPAGTPAAVGTSPRTDSPPPGPTLSSTPGAPTATATPQTTPRLTFTVQPSPTFTTLSPTPTAVDILQPANPGPEAWMQAAAEMRRASIAIGDQAYGAVIVKAGRIVGLGVSKVVVNRDPTAHAEMEAIRDACRRLETADLSGCTMYSTSRPCCMCETAASYARVDRMLVGAGLADAGAPRTCAS